MSRLGQRETTITEIAAHAGVSLGTVSHVLNNTARVRPVLRERVLAAVQQLDYQPNQFARALRRSRADLICMLIPDITNPFFPSVVRGAEDIAFAAGFRLILCNTDNDHAKEIAHLDRLLTYKPAGLVVIPSSFSDLTAQARRFRGAGTHVICVDRAPSDWSGDTFTAANFKGAADATLYMINLGHRRLASITGPLHLTNARDRLGGFRHALKQAGLPLPERRVQQSTFDKQGGYSSTKILLSQKPRPTAIFAANDMIAFGALLAMREAGVRCPDDISLMGFDDLEIASLLSPSLSSVAQPGYELGANAARLLVDRVNGYKGAAQHKILDTELRIRGSVSHPCR